MLASIPLNYAPALPWHRRRRFRRLLLGGVVLILAGCGYWFRQPLWLEMQVRYWAWACEHRHAPADQVIWSNRPEVVQRLAGDSRYTTVKSSSGNAAIMMLRPDCMRQWISLAGQPPNRSALSFFGPMRTPSGDARHIAILWGTSTEHAFTYKRNGLFTRPVEVDGQCLAAIYYLVQQHPGQLIFYPGQIDASDATHLTIPFDLNGKRGQAHLRLQDSGAFKIEIET